MLLCVPDGGADPFVDERVEVRAGKRLHRRMVVSVVSHPPGIDPGDKIGVGGQSAQAGRAVEIPSAQRTTVKRKKVQTATPMRLSPHPDRRRSLAVT